MYEWFEEEVKGLESRCAEAPSHPVAFYGSSSIRLWGSLASDFTGTPVVNLGFGGSTLAACAYFFERIVPPVDPRSLIVYAGDNDLGDGAMPDAILNSLRELLAKLDRDLPGIPFGLLSVKPSPARWGIVDRVRAVNDGARSILSARPNSVFLDVFSAMLSDTRGPRPELFEPDGLHMNRAGYRLWWQVISAERNRLLL